MFSNSKPKYNNITKNQIGFLFLVSTGNSKFYRKPVLLSEIVIPGLGSERDCNPWIGQNAIYHARLNKPKGLFGSHELKPLHVITRLLLNSSPSLNSWEPKRAS